jgi:hypothetical protein
MSTRFLGGIISATPPTVSTSSAPGVWSLEQALQYIKAGNWPVAIASDPYFKYVTMLLHGDGTNGAQNNTFLDSSTNNFTITRNGNTTQGSFSPYGSNWSNYFNGSGDYLTAPNNAAFAFGTGDFTIEAWIYCTNFSGVENFIFDSRSSASTSGMGFNIEPTTGKLRYSGNANNVLTSTSITANTWTHVAWVRSGSTLTGYINGVSGGSVSNSDNLTQNVGAVGIVGFSASGYFKGYISNLRVVKGTAVYTSTFTPSTTPLTAISGTSLLTCQSNRFIDNSTNNFAITVNGTPSVQRFSPFSPSSAYSTSVIGGSGYFDGSGDYLSISGGVTNVGTGDFTLEFWAYYTGTYSNYQFAFDSRTGLADGFSVAVNITNGYWYAGIPNQELLSSIPATKNGWDHIAVTRSGTTMRLFVNGVVGATYTTLANLTSTSNLIGWYYALSNAGYQWPGYISNLRAVKGTAVYTSAFTPPTAPVTAISGTSLLTNFTNGGIFDNAMMNNLETVGDAQISTSVVKFGTGSLKFDGTGDGLIRPVSPLFDFGSGSFTVEFWANCVSTSGSGFFVSCWEDSGGSDANSSWLIRLNSGTVITHFMQGTGTFNTLTSTSISTNTWFHFAWVKNGTTQTMYIDGTSVASGTITGAMNTVVRSLRVGYQGSATNYFNGYIDDLRITKGYARYTANFTPPTQAFPNN